MIAVAHHTAALGGLPALAYYPCLTGMLVVYTVSLYKLLVSVQGMGLVGAGKVEQVEKFEARM